MIEPFRTNFESIKAKYICPHVVLLISKLPYIVHKFLCTPDGPLPEHLARDLFMQLVDTVSECHEKGVVHRDIKDENILIDINTFKIKLIDFGSGALLQEELYRKFKGIRVYSPPEWINCGAYTAEALTV